MRAAQAIAIVVALILLLTWLSLRAFDPQAELFDRALVELDYFATIENALYRDVFTARAGTLRNYDPLVNEVDALHDSLDRLRATSAIDMDTNAAVDRLAALVDRQQELVEHFKSGNALLQNSLAFFGRFRVGADSSDLDLAITAAAAAILHLTLDTSSGSVREVQDRLDELDRQASRMGVGSSVETMLAHGRLLHGLLPSGDDTLKALRALPQKQEQEALRGMIVKHQIASRREARRYRGLLYATSLILVAFLVHLGIRLKSGANALQRRAAFEHVIAGISMRFINARPHSIDGEIDRAVTELAACTGSDRAYFVMAGPTPRLHLWHKPGSPPPPGWPAGAIELAMQLVTCADGVVHIPRVSRMPIGDSKARCLELGLGGWACATNVQKDGARVALGFDAIGRACPIKTRGELALVRMALDTILQAVERRTMEKERARLETRLRQARRMEKIGTFTSGIAHNFNNILGGILGHSEVMQEQGCSDSRFAHNLAGRGAERARDLVDQMLAFGRRRDARRNPLSVSALIAETTSLLGVSLPKGIDLVIRQPPVATIVSGDDAPLQQVILNLCNNAAHAMPDGGRIDVSTELREVSEPLALSHDDIGPGHYVCIAVTDTGHGMDEAILGRIFEPFFTTRLSGNGLGLATVREIAHEHGGAVSVQSKVNEGSRFEVWLPRATAEPASEAGGAAFPGGRGATVMLVAHDAEGVLRDEEMLAALGYEPVGFTNADAALAACRADADRFDMAVVGHFGPAARSLELAAALHAAAPRLPIVLASKAVIEIGADAVLTAGIADVVRWPIIAEELAMALADSAALTRPDGRLQRQPARAFSTC
ncbi:two-component system VirA-like sensor kinase [Bradyrhizobium genosp. A]|uniref:two-component system VirA-like sensor kinase n=1 Tax=Bradyrhizobium genosp. A TaxID=83626 RepID=UPI003CF8587A